MIFLSTVPRFRLNKMPIVDKPDAAANRNWFPMSRVCLAADAKRNLFADTNSQTRLHALRIPKDNHKLCRILFQQLGENNGAIPR